MNRLNSSTAISASVLTAVVSMLALARPAEAGTITFESIPGVAMPTDGMTISTQFQADFGVSFSLEGGGNPVLAMVGSPQTAFQGYNLLPDQPAPGVDAGLFFLTDDGVVAGPPTPLIVTYTDPVAAASGILLDIDGTEAWQVQLRDALNTVIDFVNLGPNNSLDGSATAWSFSHQSADVSIPDGVYGSQLRAYRYGIRQLFAVTCPPSVPEPRASLSRWPCWKRAHIRLPAGIAVIVT